jgi:hypothetical protein
MYPEGFGGLLHKSDVASPDAAEEYVNSCVFIGRLVTMHRLWIAPPVGTSRQWKDDPSWRKMPGGVPYRFAEMPARLRKWPGVRIRRVVIAVQHPESAGRLRDDG